MHYKHYWTKGYSSDDLYVGVMWSGIERKELFVSAQETDKVF